MARQRTETGLACHAEARTGEPASRGTARRENRGRIDGDEHAHQVALFAWADNVRRQYPELALLFAVPNGGQRSPRTAARLKAEGVRAGVPDVCLPVPRGGMHGLFIELKRPGLHSVSPVQREWIETLSAYGYRAEVAVGWDAARELIVEYLSGGGA